MDKLLFPNWRDEVIYGKQGPEPRILVEENGFRALIVGLEPGARIPPHPEGVGMYHFVEGSGWMIVDEERLRVQPGATVIAPAGSTRGVEAETRLAFVASRFNNQTV